MKVRIVVGMISGTVIKSDAIEATDEQIDSLRKVLDGSDPDYGDGITTLNRFTVEKNGRTRYLNCRNIEYAEVVEE